MRREDGAGYIGESECKDWLRAWNVEGEGGYGGDSHVPSSEVRLPGPETQALDLTALESSVSYLIDL